jgi:hypothetical protein
VVSKSIPIYALIVPLVAGLVAPVHGSEGDDLPVRRAFYEYFSKDPSMDRGTLEIVEIIDLKPLYGIDLLQVNYDILSSGFRMPAALYMTRDGRFVLAGKLQDSQTMLNITRELVHTKHFRFDTSLIPEDGSPTYPWGQAPNDSLQITLIGDFASSQSWQKLITLKAIARAYRGTVRLRHLSYPASEKARNMTLLLQAASTDPATYWALIDRFYREYSTISEASLEPDLVSRFLPEGSQPVLEAYGRALNSGEALFAASRLPVRIVPLALVEDIVLTEEMSADEIRLLIEERIR